MKNITYEELKNEVDKKIPNCFKTGEIVKFKELSRCYYAYELNVNPYKNEGKILPYYISVYDKGELEKKEKNPHYIPVTYNVERGAAHTLELMAYMSDKYPEDYAPLFILIFFHDFSDELEEFIEKKNIKNIVSEAKDYIFKEYRKDYRTCRTYMPFYAQDENCLREKFLDDIYMHRYREYDSVSKLATLIVEMIHEELKDIDAVVWRYSDSEYQRADLSIRSAYENFMDNILHET